MSEKKCDQLLLEIIHRVKEMNRDELEQINNFVKDLEGSNCKQIIQNKKEGI